MTQHPAFIPAPDQAPQLPELPSSVAADPSRNHLEVAFPRSLGRSTELGEQREADVGIVEIALHPLAAKPAFPAHLFEPLLQFRRAVSCPLLQGSSQIVLPIQ